MRILMKILNEEFEIGRCLKDFHDESWVDEIIIIDGGSTDYTVHEANCFEKTKIFIHPYLDWYHAAEIMQANIMMSYVNHGEICFLLDADERMSDGLKKLLNEVNETKRIPGEADLAHVARKTYEVIRHEDSPFCVYEDDGWPMISHQIGQFPDYQPRLIRRHHNMHWIHSPHRTLVGANKMGYIENHDAHIIHYEKDDIRKRHSIERRWLRPDATRKKLGLVNDLYETGAKPEYAEATNPEFWKDGK